MHKIPFFNVCPRNQKLHELHNCNYIHNMIEQELH